MPYPSRATRRRVALTVGRLQDDARIATRMAQRVAADGGIIEFECLDGRSPQTLTAAECQRDRTYCGTSVYLAEVATIERRLGQEFSYSSRNARPSQNKSFNFRTIFKSQESLGSLNISVSMRMFYIVH